MEIKYSQIEFEYKNRGVIWHNNPNFRARYTARYCFPTFRAYVHRSGLKESFYSPTDEKEEISLDEKALMHMSDIYDEGKNGGVDLSKFQFVLSLIWGNKGDKMVDLFGFSDLDSRLVPIKLPGNPDVDNYVFRNGVYTPERKTIVCGDGLIVLGAEEEYRRQETKNLAEYLRSPQSEFSGMKFGRRKIK